MRPFLALLALSTTALAQQCYYPAGNPSTDVPCSSSGGTCCASKDLCLSNGLCAVSSSGSASGTQFARGSCTDQNWGSSCFQYCDKISYPGSLWTNIANVFICDGSPSSQSNYCCETGINQGTGCCSGTTFSLPAGTPLGGATPSSSAAPKSSAHVLLQQAPSSSSSSSSSSSASATVTTVSSSSSSSSTSAEATAYTTSSVVSFGGNSTIAATGTGVASTSGTGSSGSAATGSPIGPANPSATGAASTVGAGFGLMMALAGAVLLL